MVLQNNRLPGPQMLGNPPPLFTIKHHTAKLRVHGVVVVEAQTVLRHHVQLAAKDGPRFAVDAVRVACGVHVGACFVDL